MLIAKPLIDLKGFAIPLFCRVEVSLLFSNQAECVARSCLSPDIA
jgi:hypothetical protein